MLATVFAVLLTAATPSPGASAAARIIAQQARWTGLAPVDELGAGEDGMFLISGEVRNDGPLPLAEVQLVYELLADGVVVASEHGYNRRAEALRDPEVESGAVRRESLAIAPLLPGESDLFRMVFLRGAVPPFDSWRVRVDTATPAAAPSRSTPAPPR
ncbi:MAG TPA: hypothetical protein VL049_16030 [Candidatus Dormibacteraeota bacterium]|nr:hypothetical protein [Candidatus Dormibacteraeota bacterium]